MTPWSAVVLAGGGGRRLGGIDKAELTREGSRLLDHILGELGTPVQVVVVGPERATGRPVRWAREEPTGCGPLAAVAAGLQALDHTVPLVLVAAVDQPRLGDAVPALLSSLEVHVEAPSSVLIDRDGRRQPLLSAHRTGPLAAHLAALGALTDRPARLLLALGTVDVPDIWDAAADLDTAEQARLLGWALPGEQGESAQSS